MEEEGRMRERVRERRRVIITILAVAIAIILASWFGIIKPAREAAYKASITEIEAKILGFEWFYNKPTPVKLRKIDTQEELTIKFSMPFKAKGSRQDLPKVYKQKYSRDEVWVDSYELGETSVYWIKYGGIEVKDVLDIKLIQSREEWIKKQADSNKRPDINNWNMFRRDGYPLHAVESLERFDYSIKGNIICHAFYDITKEEPVLGAMDLRYKDKKYKTFARKVWIRENSKWVCYEIKENALWKRENGKQKLLYRLEKGDTPKIYFFKENGQVKFELR